MTQLPNGLTMIREVAIEYRGTPNDATRIGSAAGFFEYCKASIADDAAEHFLAVYLDNRNRPIGARVVSIGTATASLVHPREVFQAAIHLGAVSLLVAHNHPSGELEPSDADREVTERLGLVGALLGIELLDHLIWNRETGFHSMATEGQLPDRKLATRDRLVELVMRLAPNAQ